MNQHMNLPYSPGDQLAGRYEIRKYLAKGGMQYVYLAFDSLLKRQVVLKTPQETASQIRFNESAILSARINHFSVAKTLDYFDFQGRAHLIEEYVSGDNLHEALLSRVYYLDPFLVAKLFHHLAKGLEASHAANVVHRDLKPTNIMITGEFSLSEIKITDFGIAKLVAGEFQKENDNLLTRGVTTSGTVMGAIPYMAPEVIEDLSNSTFPADVWSLGAIMYHCLTGKLPFGDKALLSIGRILNADYLEIPKFVTENIQYRALANEILDLIKACFSLNPDLRPTAKSLVHQCGNLCYQVSERYVGMLGFYPLSPSGYTQSAYCFINDLSGQQDAFYHRDNVYGEHPDSQDLVVYAKYKSRGQFRASPIIRMKLNS